MCKSGVGRPRMMLKVGSQLSHFCPEVKSDEALSQEAAEVTEERIPALQEGCAG